MQLVIALLLLVSSLPVEAQATYSKSTEFSALRVSYAALQSIINKGHTLANAANGGSNPIREEIDLQGNEIKVTLAGHQFDPSTAKIPDQLDRLTYSYISSPQAAITQLELSLRGYERVLTVRGTSVDQVDALFAALASELSKLSHPVGGGPLPSFLKLLLATLLASLGAATGWNWYVTRSRGYAATALGSAAGLLLLFVLPLDQLLAGFLAVRGDPSALVRYGAEISFIGLVIAIVGAPASVLPFLARSSPQEEVAQPADTKKRPRRKADADSVTPNPSIERTPPGKPGGASHVKR